MPDTISDTSPIQYLHQIGQLDFLPGLYGPVIIPSAVVSEIQAGLDAGISLPLVNQLAWIRVVDPSPPASLVLPPRLGAGEVAALTLAAQRLDSLVLLDDRIARTCAESLKIRVTGTLGILLRAKQQGLIPSVAPMVRMLHSLGFRIAPQTMQDILTLAGEAP